MEEVGSYQAKARLAELLDKVAQGESIVITRNGQPAAVLCAPPRARSSTVEATIADLRTFRERHTLGMDLKTAIEEGRR